MSKRKSLEIEPEIFFNRVIAEAEKVGETTPFVRTFSLNGTVVRMVSLEKEIHADLSRAFSHLPSGDNLEPSLSIFSLSASGENRSPIHFPEMKQMGNSGRDIPFIEKGGVKMILWRDSGSLNALNKERGAAFFLSKAPSRMAYYEKAAPFRNIFQWWFDGQDTSLLHSGAVGINGEGLLIAGRGGSGKTSTVISSVMNGMDYLGDDYVLVSRRRGYQVFSLYNSVKLPPFPVRLFPKLAERIEHRCFSNEDKGLAFFDDGGKPLVPSFNRLKGILVPYISGRVGSSCSEAPSSEIFRALAPSTVFQHAGNRKNLLRMTGKLAKDLPGFRLHAGRDPVRLSDTVREVLEQIK